MVHFTCTKCNKIVKLKCDYTSSYEYIRYRVLMGKKVILLPKIQRIKKLN